MSSNVKQSSENAANNGSLGKRKKTRSSKGSYLSKWLDKSVHHIQDATPSMETYDPLLNPSFVNSQYPPGYDPYRFNLYATEPMSLPTLSTYCNPFYPDYYLYKNAQMQKPVQRQRSDKEELHSTQNGTTNGNYMQPKNFTDSQDFTSLPPIITSVGDTNSNSDMNTNEKDDGAKGSNARRFSDPCLRGLPDVARPANGDVESESEDSSEESGSQVGSRLLTCLLDQISSLKMANERLSKELQETKAEISTMRYHNAVIYRGPSSRFGGTNQVPYNTNALINGQYSPGFLTDLVREIRDASRMREEALYSSVRSMLVERNETGLSSSEAKVTEKALDDIKSSLRASEADKRRMMDRISKLESELRILRVGSGLETNENVINGNLEDPEMERVRLRKELAEMRKAKQNAEEHSHKLERLVTQLRSKFNGLQITNGPDSLPSESEHEGNARARRTSVNSSTNSTVVFGPVTDL